MSSEKHQGGKAGVPASPSGTRDFYPTEMRRRQYLERAWRDAAIRHGFEEIDGPTFEHLDLYTIKSGEGIVSELFSFQRAGGEKTYALRPEFTPTLARLYAQRAGSLPKPTRWFWQQSCFRAERPQRGRLREFLQWNVDVVGVGGGDATVESLARADADVIACLVDLLGTLGLRESDVRVRLSHRGVAGEILRSIGVGEGGVDRALQALDKVAKLPATEAEKVCAEAGFVLDAYRNRARAVEQAYATGGELTIVGGGEIGGGGSGAALAALRSELESSGISGWCVLDLSIARGLAYYTGTVFEAIADGERAVAGGGRYDNLIGLFGGPATPAIGFGMGDVVLGLVLESRGLWPDDAAIMDALSARPASRRPEAFVISNGTVEADGAVRGLVARLRAAGLHARTTSKATKNVGKLLQEASALHARAAVIVESTTTASVKDLKTGEQSATPMEFGEVVERLGREA